jgi:N-acetylmuramic acid 6-phosphate (MurNAc-6-P) etherase
MGVHVTQHAIDRYIERVAPVAREEAYAAMACADAAIERARSFGANVVRIAGGAGLVITGTQDIRIVTVLGPGMIAGGHYAKLSHRPISRPRAHEARR